MWPPRGAVFIKTWTMPISNSPRRGGASSTRYKWYNVLFSWVDLRQRWNGLLPVSQYLPDGVVGGTSWALGTTKAIPSLSTVLQQRKNRGTSRSVLYARRTVAFGPRQHHTHSSVINNKCLSRLSLGRETQRWHPVSVKNAWGLWNPIAFDTAPM